MMKSPQQAQAELAWYLINTGGCAERLAKFHLERQGFAVYLPMRAVAKKTAEHAIPFFPRYLFVGQERERPRWDVIRSTIGVQAIVRTAGSIGRVPSWSIERLRAREVFGLITLADVGPGATPALKYRRGDRLRVLDGALAGFDAVFDRRCSDARRIHVMLSVFGRVMAVELPTKAVAKIEA